MILSTIQSDSRFLVFGDSTNTQYGDTDLNRNINSWYRRAIGWILSVNGEWQVNGEIATCSIVAEQREYILPTDILKLNEVYIKYGSNTEYVKAKQRDANTIDEIEPDSYPHTPYPPEFDLNDNSIFIYTPEETIAAVTDGIKIHYQTEITALSDSGDAPNLAEPFERLLSYGSAYDYALANGMRQKQNDLKSDIADIRVELLDFYANRSTVKPTRIIPKDKNYY